MSKIADIDFVNQVDKVSGGSLTFARSGVAVNKDGSSTADGVMRVDTVNVASPVVYTEDSTYNVLAADKNYIYAQSNYILYRSTDGADWEQIATLSAAAQKGFITSTGALLLGVATAAGGTTGTIHRWDGTELTEVMADGVLTTGATVAPWSTMGEADGWIFASEYRTSMTADNARCLYGSSDDGKTWSKVYNPAHVADRHLHACVVTVVDGAVVIYMAYGDTTEKAMFKVTKTAADSFSATEVNLYDWAQQPTCGCWVPEGNRVAWASDGTTAKGVFLQNLADDSFSPAFRFSVGKAATDTHTYNAGGNFLSMIRSGGVYLTAITNTGTDHSLGGIYASSDLNNWIKVVSYDTTDNLYLRGVDGNGKVWCAVAYDSSFYFDLPRIDQISGALIERASVNVADGTPLSQSTSYHLVTDTEGVWVGYKSGDCCRWRNDVLGDQSYGPIVAASYLYLRDDATTQFDTGDQGIIHFRIKGTFGDGSGNNLGDSLQKCVRVSAIVKDGDGGDSETKYWRLYINGSDWQHFIVPIKSTNAHTAGTSKLECFLHAMASADPEDGQYDLLVDGLTFEKAICPSEWSDPASNRNADVLYYNPSTWPAAFTDSFTVTFRYSSVFMSAISSGDAASYIYLRSYSVDSNNFFAVVYDVNDYKFKLVNEVGGVQTVVATLSTAVHFWNNESFTVVVTRTGTSAILYVVTSGSLQSQSATITDHTIDRAYYGSHPDGTQGGSLVFTRNAIYDGVLPTAVIENEIYNPAPMITAVETVSVSGARLSGGARGRA